MYARLSDLTPAVVDAMYHIDSADPQAEPTFLFLVGAPGSGKSSGHARAVAAGILPPAYATINMDTLLESLTPFRAASSMAHFLKRSPATAATPMHFGSIGAYGTRKENLGLFKWYDEAHDTLAAADPATIAAFNRVRDRFAPLNGQEAEARLLDINEAALHRAIQRQIPIVYETTLSLTKAGRVNKVDDLMSILKKTPYRVVFYHITGSVEDIAQRIRARQEHSTPKDPMPFYRYFPTGHDAVASIIRNTADAFAAVQKRYKKVAQFEEFENPTDPTRAPSENRRTASAKRRQILRAYGSGSGSPSELRSSDRVSRLSSSNRKTQKKKSE